MATVMDGVQDATFSFPIVRKEYTPDGDLLVYGKATDGTVDSDNQIVDPDWSGKALQEWLATGGNVRVQHSPHLYPAGKGVEVVVGKDGAHWVRSMIVEATAKNLVEKGVLTSYSVGIARPQIVRSYDAPGGRIVGGIIAELSLVDRPANKNCAFQLCKSEDGRAEFVGKMFGDEDFIGKVGPKGYSHGWIRAGAPSKLPTKGLGDRKKAGAAGSYNRSLDDIGRHEGHDLDASDHFNLAGHHDNAAHQAKKLGETDRHEHHVHAAQQHRAAGMSFARPDSPARGMHPDVPGQSKAVPSQQDWESQVHQHLKDSGLDSNDVETHVEGFGQDYADYKNDPAGYAQSIADDYRSVGDMANEGDAYHNSDHTGRNDKSEDGSMFTPKDLANVVTKRDFSAAQRDAAASSGAAMSDGSFPIKNGGDLRNAIRLAGNASDPEAARKHIKRRATALGLADRIPDSWKGVDADLAKGSKNCPNCGTGHDADSKARSCRDCGTKLPHADKSDGADLEERADADLEKGSMPPQFAAHAKKKPGGDAEDAADGGADDAEEDDSKPAFLQGKSAQPTDGVKAKDSDPLPRHREPDGGQVAELERDAGLGTEGEGPSDGLPNGIWSDNMGSNTPDTMKGASYSVNRLHDALCSAFDPDDVAHEYPSMKGLIGAINDAWDDLDGVTRQIVKGLGEAASMDGTTTDGLILDEARATLTKSFGEMYPNVHVTPGKITAGQFTRPYLSAGHPQLSIQSPAHMPGPGDASFGSTETMHNASQFNRSNITAGHARTSPSSAGNNGNSIPGSRPARARLAAAAKAEAANAMQVLHDRLAEHHPYLCPMSPGTPAQISAVAKTSAETDELRSLVEKQSGELAELRKAIDELGAQPDPGAAPHRGITVNKSASGGTGPADRRSLVDEANMAEQQERVAFYNQIATSGDAGLREAAQQVLRAQTPTN